MSKTINQALKELYLSLGGDPSALEDNSTVSDYIADLENGLKGLAELPTPSSDNSGKIAKVVSDGEGGYIWGAENETSELPAPAVGDIGKIVGAVSDGESGAEYGLIDAPSDTLYALFGYDTTDNAYVYKGDYYGNTHAKQTWEQLAEDLQGKKNVIAWVDTKDDPNFTDVFTGNNPVFRLQPQTSISATTGESWGVYGALTGSILLNRKSDNKQFEILPVFNISANQWSPYISLYYAVVDLSTLT